MNKFLTLTTVYWFILFLVPNSVFCQSASDKIEVLIVDGFSNHDWKQTSSVVKSILEESGLFKVSISTAPIEPEDEVQKKWNPKFKEFDVVIQNTNNINNKKIRWPKRVEEELEKYVKSGGGLYVFHSANNAFSHWDEYDLMIGLGWRSKDQGVALQVKDNGEVMEIPVGEGKGTYHGPRNDEVIHVLNRPPINKGFPNAWNTPDMELYKYARGPAKNLTVLSYAKEPETGINWPVDWTVAYGKGRVYNSSMGHLWEGETYPVSYKCVGFQTLLIRATEWLATGQTSYKMPKNFPAETQNQETTTEKKPLTLVVSQHPFESYARGLHALTDDLVWISGSNGAWLKTEDGGNTWTGDTLEYKVDFRDIHAFNNQEAVMVSAEDDHVFILKTTDGGANWKVVHEDSSKGTFFDGLDFLNDTIGFAYGDPINQKMNLLKTVDQGETWETIDTALFPKALYNEAGFAASGSGLIVMGSSIYIAQGGDSITRVLISRDLGASWAYVETPIIGGDAKGIFGMDFYDEQTGHAVGGGYLQVADTINNSAFTTNGGKTWKLSNTMAKGFRSGVTYFSRDTLFCTGLNGIDISVNGGKDWKAFSDAALYSVQAAPNTIWFCGRKGKIGKIVVRE